MEGIYPLHTSLSPPLTPSGRHAVRLSRFDDPSLTHKGVEKKPQTGKPRWTVEHQAPDWVTSRTQSVHSSDDSNLDLGFPQRGKAYGSTCGQPPPQGSRGPFSPVEATPSAQSRPPLSRAAATRAQAWRNQCACHRRRGADLRPTHAPFGNPHPSFRAGPPSADRQPSDMNP